MHTDDLSPWEHTHIFDAGNPEGERNTRLVVLITAVMMVFEIAAGYVFNSMALLADGWHMGTHAAALGLTAAAYLAARKYASDERFSFGTWKIEILGGFASAIVLGMVALYVAAESIARLFHPLTIHYNQALSVAVIGLMVNLVCAFLLGSHGHEHGQNETGRNHEHSHHDTGSDHDHGHHHKDLNLKSAYLHVVADAATSVFAIIALVGGKFFNWSRLDPIMGLVGASVIAVWAFGLIRDTGRILVDWRMDKPIIQKIYQTIESDGDTRICDLHLWQVGRNTYSCILQLVADNPRSLEEYRKALSIHKEIGHLIIEINLCSCAEKKKRITGGA